MQKDMHYCGVYALARAAGLNPDAARTVATSSQFVDDCPESFTASPNGGQEFDVIATAHHAIDIANLSRPDQIFVWVPFHFIPGNVGVDFKERLVCRKDSPIARAMFDQALNELPSEQGVHRLGIAAHAYADTFSHYGFSGVCSRYNEIINNSIAFNMTLDPEIAAYLTKKFNEFLKKYSTGWKGLANIISWSISWIIEIISGALGHAAVATYPDRPYLIWSFDYEHPRRPSGERNNQATYLDCCEQLHGLFVKAVKTYPQIGSGPAVSFQQISAVILGILKTQAKLDARSALWSEAAKNGLLLPGQPFEIPDYDGEQWFENGKMLVAGNGADPAAIQELRLFSQAAKEHRDLMIKKLLPTNGIAII